MVEKFLMDVVVALAILGVIFAICGIACKLGKSEDYSKNVDELTSLDKFREWNKESLNLFRINKKAKDLHELYVIKKAAQESNNKLSTKQRIKVNMDMMKSTLKEDN